MRIHSRFNKVISNIAFALECFLSLFQEGETITIEFLDDTPCQKGSKSFKAKTNKTRKLRRRLAGHQVFEQHLTAIPPAFRGGELLFAQSNGVRQYWYNYPMSKSGSDSKSYIVRTFCKKEQKTRQSKQGNLKSDKSPTMGKSLASTDAGLESTIN